MLNVYGIMDKKAKSVSPIFIASNDDVAIRNCRGMVNTEGNTFHDFPEDFALYQLGTMYDDGVILPCGMSYGGEGADGYPKTIFVIDFEKLTD